MLRILTSLYAIFLSFSIVAAEIPPELAKWEGWVKYQQEFRNCPSLNGQLAGKKAAHLCAWPSLLTLQVEDSQGSFSQVWEVIEESRVPLPGDLRHWPQEVLVNNRKASVLQEQNQPYLLLNRGRYQIQGRFFWDKRPESIYVPAANVLFKVTVNNETQEFVAVNNNQLWLGSIEKADVKEKDYLRLWANRLITDGHPMTMTVALNMQVSGRAREQKITRFSPQNYQLMKVNSGLNTRIDSNGNLWMQLKPGEHQAKLTFKLHGNNDEIQFQEVGDEWPKQEIWIYQANERLRSTQIEGLASIDAEQGFVNEWKRLPHYVINAGDSLTINERQRGLSHNFDSLALSRNMWLSFDSENYYFFDVITGEKSKDWRVNTIDGYRLTQLSNHEQQRLITLDDQKRTGAEIRTPQINIKASGEVPKALMNHASGWDMPLARTEVILHIPPGRKLFHISGADFSHGDWISQWDLIDLFFVLVIVALVFKVFGLTTSIIALLTLALGYHESDMPVFLWFNLVVALALVLKVTSPKLKKWAGYYRWLSVGILALVMLPFVADQIRYTLFPQLEFNQTLSSEYPSSRGIYGLVAEEKAVTSIAPPSPAPELLERQLQALSDEESVQRVVVTGSRIKRQELDLNYDAGAVIQAGKGRPSWHWQRASYAWNGIVTGDETVNIQVIPQWGVKLLRILLVILSLLWIWMLFKKGSDDDEKETARMSHSSQTATSTATMFMFALVFSGLTISPSSDASDFPSDKLLNELKQRLYPIEECHPDCVDLASASIEINNLNALLKLRYFSESNKVGLLPNSEDWRIDKVTLNGRVVRQLWKNHRGVWLQLPTGEANVELKVSLKDKPDIAWKFLEKPKRIQLSKISGWEASGIVQQSLRSNELLLTRIINSKQKESESTVENITEQSIAGLFNIHRHFVFGSQWSLRTSVQRLAPEVGTLTTQVPLYSFEQPLEQTDSVDKEMMSAVIPSNDYSFDWSSSISSSNTFELTALSDNSKLETWEILVYPNWNIQIDGVPAVLPESFSSTDYWVYLYYPRAGEKLTFTMTKPPAAKGDSVAISKVVQKHNVSKRKTTTSLNIDYLATRAEPLLVHIGEAELKQLQHDGQQVNLGAVEGVVSVNLKPGKHHLFFELEQKTDTSIKMNLLSPKLNKEFTNLTTQVSLPDSRWLIAASGPGYGPAVIYWGELLFFILLAIGLSRLSFSPISYWQWLLLGLGMSTFSWFALAWVVVWILGSEWLRRNIDRSREYPVLTNWLILVVTLIAVVALVSAVPKGLLYSPDMGVVGNGSYGNQLFWFLDRGAASLGEVSVITLPLWIYKGLMLLWATWLSFSLIKWLGWTWKDLQSGRFFKPSSPVQGKTDKSEIESPQVEDKNND